MLPFWATPLYSLNSHQSDIKKWMGISLSLVFAKSNQSVRKQFASCR